MSELLCISPFRRALPRRSFLVFAISIPPQKEKGSILLTFGYKFFQRLQDNFCHIHSMVFSVSCSFKQSPPGDKESNKGRSAESVPVQVSPQRRLARPAGSWQDRISFSSRVFSFQGSVAIEYHDLTPNAIRVTMISCKDEITRQF